jgi:N-succinyldiaminopimelate aminotransferase
VLRAGGVPKFVTLKPPHFRFSAEDLAQAFSPRTKVVLFNNPLNPVATVCPPEDLAMLAHFCIANDAIALCDEVWEHVIFDGLRHVPLASLPGMGDRTVKIGSAGKIFSLTGWKVGFVCAPAPIMKVLAKAHQFLTFTTPPNLQAAVAHGLMKDDAYFTGMRADFARSRDRLADGLKTLGLAVLPAQGTYFLTIDIAPLGASDDVAWSQRLVAEHGVATIPVSAFYAEEPVRTVVRFCFAKKDATIDAALERMESAVKAV